MNGFGTAAWKAVWYLAAIVAAWNLFEVSPGWAALAALAAFVLIGTEYSIRENARIRREAKERGLDGPRPSTRE